MFFKSSAFLLKFYLRSGTQEGIGQELIIKKCAQCETNTMNYNCDDTPVITKYDIFYIRKNNNGNRTEWSPVRSVIIRVINKIERPRSGSPIC